METWVKTWQYHQSNFIRAWQSCSRGTQSLHPCFHIVCTIPNEEQIGHHVLNYWSTPLMKERKLNKETRHKPVSYPGASLACPAQAEVPQYSQTGGSRRHLSLVDNLTPAVATDSGHSTYSINCSYFHPKPFLCSLFKRNYFAPLLRPMVLSKRHKGVVGRCCSTSEPPVEVVTTWNQRQCEKRGACKSGWSFEGVLRMWPTTERFKKLG